MRESQGFIITMEMQRWKKKSQVTGTPVQDTRTIEHSRKEEGAGKRDLSLLVLQN